MDDHMQLLIDLEVAISEEDIAAARKALRSWFSAQDPSVGTASTIGEWLKSFVDSSSDNSNIAAVVVRCLSIQGLIEPNRHNQIERSIVHIAEKNLSELVAFQKIDTKDQTFSKYQKLIAAQNNANAILEPLYRPYGDINVLAKERHVVMKALSYNSLKRYLKPFGFDEIRTRIENIFGILNRVVRHEDTLLDDLDACREAIREAQVFSEQNYIFLIRDYFSPFIANLENVFNSFLEQMHGRFLADIELVASDETLKKRYPLSEQNRQIKISVPFRNTGPGKAIDVRVLCDDNDANIKLDTMALHLGNVSAGVFEVNINCMIVRACADTSFILSVEWGEIDSPHRKSKSFLVHVHSQNPDINWQQLEYASPYSTEVAEGDAFFGREDKVKQLAAKILRTPMEPFYLTGQRRVGKTSLAKAAATFAEKNAHDFELHTHYILWGSVADVRPTGSLQRLGESIHDFIAKKLPDNAAIPKGNYVGSLGDIIKLANFAWDLAPAKRFLLILDEIDDMSSELYFSGDLASTFFGNLRALSRAKNVGLILVGGENMPYIMDRQGLRLNNFSRINLTSYDRGSEWEDFCLLVQQPTHGQLNWHEEAVSEIYNVTDGNPYFAKLICAGIFRRAVRERDADIAVNEVTVAVDREISTLGANSFAHLWQDGIPKEEKSREPETLLRLRVLIALARCLRKHVNPSLEQLRDHRATEGLLESEIWPTLNEFCRRGIMHEKEDRYFLTLPIFEMWLADVGASELVADGLSEEIANSILKAENAELVTAAEVLELVEKLPTYCGRQIGSDQIRAWFEQVDDKREQRILFEILKRIRFYSEISIRERLRQMHDMFRRSLPQFIQTKRNEKRTDILITYADGPGKSGAGYASLYAEENSISASLVVAPELLSEKLDESMGSASPVNGVVLVDDIAGTGRSLSGLLQSLVEKHPKLRATKLLIAVLVATPEAEKTMVRAIDKLSDVSIEFRVGELLTEVDRAFSADYSSWGTKKRKEDAEALCRNIGARIYKKQPFGYGGQGLLIVFPTTVPNNTLPILHSPSKDSKFPWKPLFPRPVN